MERREEPCQGRAKGEMREKRLKGERVMNRRGRRMVDK